MFQNLYTKRLRTPQPSWCARPSAKWNAEIPMGGVSKTTLQQLDEWNQHDTKLYKELTSCGGPENVVFPSNAVIQSF